jgi:hypothetical protein
MLPALIIEDDIELGGSRPHRQFRYDTEGSRRRFHLDRERRTSASWLNAVEGFFSAITRRRIRRGAFDSVDHLQNAITRYIDSHNSDCRPFVWTTSAKAIMRGSGRRIGYWRSYD